jgi:hypothetical protein
VTSEPDDSGGRAGGVIKQTIDSATALAKAVPIYEDAIQPLAKETGKALATVGRAVNAALAPLSALVWGYDKIREFLETRIAEKLEKVPEDRIQTPPLNVAGPAVEALRFTGSNDTLRELFANLIATSLDKKTATDAHPSFVDIIRSLSPDEGRILYLFTGRQVFPLINVQLKIPSGGYHVLHRNVTTLGIQARCDHPELAPNYLDNLCRLGLLEVPTFRRINGDEAYATLLGDPGIVSLKNSFQGDKGPSLQFDYGMVESTNLGQQFIRACVVDKALRT